MRKANETTRGNNIHRNFSPTCIFANRKHWQLWAAPMSVSVDVMLASTTLILGRHTYTAPTT